MRNEHYIATFDVPLIGDVDLERILDRALDDYTVKGMFFTRYVSDSDWSDLKRDLVSPPPNGRYAAFDAYPLVDYLRVYGRAAKARFPGATREAFRLLARGEVDVFADSMFGKVTLALIDNPRRALEQFPRVLGVLSKGFTCVGSELSPGRHQIRLPNYVGVIEVVLGLLEGIVLIFEKLPTIEVDRDATNTVTYVVSWA